MFRIFLVWLAMAMTVQAASAPGKIFPYPYVQKDLPNGLRVVTVPTDYPNLVTLFIVMNVGSRNEVEPGKSGFAHFFEHVMFRGTKRYTPAQWEAVMKTAGANTNAFTSDDLTAFHATFSKEGLPAVLALEADRFMNLDYSEALFRTEALAVNGEYNKNSSNPTTKLNEVLRDTAFDRHTYKHTTMGFLADIKNMPNQYEYSKQFFDRFYRPENATILVVGDVNPPEVEALVEKYWGGWKRGSYKVEVPAEEKQKAAREAHIDWPAATPPWLAVMFKTPAYSDSDRDTASLDLIASLAFGPNSPLYQRLVIADQKVDALYPADDPHVDPYLFGAVARVKKEADVGEVREAILSTLNGFKDTLVDKARLDAVKKHLRYDFALGLDNSESIAETLAYSIALRRTPETLNRLYDVYDSITPEDLRAAARKYFLESGRTIVTLTGAPAK